MKIIIMLLLVSLSFFAAAQSSSGTFDLSPYDEFNHFKQLPFDSVAVIDNRIDNRVSVLGDGTEPVKISRLDSASLCIQRLITVACKKAVTIHQTLYIDIREMRFSNEFPILLYFYVEAYIPVGSGFHKVASVKQGLRNEGKINEAYFKKEIKKGFAELLKEVAKDELNDTIIYKISDLSRNITSEWESVPILSASTFPKAATYNFWGALRQNKYADANIVMNKQEDGTYSMAAANGKHLHIDVATVYAASYEGELYIRLQGNFFVPVTRTKGLLHFQIPPSIPGMNVLFGIHRQVEDNNDYIASDVPAALAQLTVSLLGNFQLKHYMNVYQRAKETAASVPGSIIDLRDCYIDMDTGDFIYY